MENPIQNKKIETYAEDMAKAMESGQGGVVKKMILEQEAKESEKSNQSLGSNENKIFLSVSIVLVVLATSAMAYIFLNPNSSAVPVSTSFTPVIFTDKTQYIEVGGLKKDPIAQTLLNETNKSDVKPSGIEGIYLTENKNTVVGLRKFLTLIQARLDQSQITFMTDNLFLGVFKKNTTIVPTPPGGNFFILLKMRSVTDIFNPVHTWENKMFEDLHGFFGIDITPDTNYLLTKDFVDGFISNKNARILYDQDGKIVLMYVFVDDTSMVITNNEDAVSEVVARLSSGQVRK